ncbi:hypothetical protein TREAZ_2917 [Leadbettera azotonutricia ZAS-9]|uniref:Uncharacterized protein n=1 Tax=Leadbettera azotonutricia (strain ATCC BAA-888 / DSM 13862 / ZAS-9) TaxID=545695 RepID=F5YBU9_LEAAZ|nr:hypothetical protein TREAZ_2917 [Leadbettera azotonutricia ZAS-9]
MAVIPVSSIKQPTSIILSAATNTINNFFIILLQKKLYTNNTIKFQCDTSTPHCLENF